MVAEVLGGASLGEAEARWLPHCEGGRERAFARHLAFATLRWQPRLEHICARLLRHPLRRRDRDLQALLLIGLCQLLQLETPPHAAVGATVEVCRALDKPWARALVNGLLRNCLRRREELLRECASDPVCHHAHPAWLLELLQRDWPEHWQEITAAGNRQPPMALRVNRRRCGRERYLRLLREAGLEASPLPDAPEGVLLHQPVEVSELPGFGQGLVSVQDGAAQLAAHLLDLHPGQRVLDACAAPGGKSAHLLETCDGIDLLALDLEPGRLERVRENLERLGLQAGLRSGDATEPEEWWDGRPFDRILLDAPCSGSGVIRRHPDIKLLRQAGDIPRLAQRQARLLERLWPLLAPGGLLLYATCSVLAEENQRRVRAFLAAAGDARSTGPEASWGIATNPGRQLLPGDHDRDGFFYACLRKE
ncbi:MAG: 16S rRNA (cytosine(967)-C(5))-methyltransferase RsmB [Gammaproteobacteria bacterium]|nr:MAG: 16S rRNA (cytosine(967)-C(5))-methyltransferase RsmB [Gammaproteobacteria bacterium]